MEDPLLSFSQGKLTKGNINLNRNICLIIFCVFFNLATWLCIILTIYHLIFKESHGNSITFLIIGIICYCIYFILELCSQTFKFLLSKSGEKIHKTMEKFLKIKPKVEIFFESYHMEQRHSQGGGSYTVKVTTFSKTMPL